ncbi:hypothetical protein OJAV_G00232950 [Oryzias javanicus]|uniref:A-kinase anchor protein 7-like phosphoesterase domain-containing protein n=1 Tax=Oryzias javanicus TaxID=123683 RepID=A0A3S2P3C6_ORYJA|nr:hypothetical protein OJAV_G00232950 [Oryzias javanicus]
MSAQLQEIDNEDASSAAAMKELDVKTNSEIQTQTPQEGHHEPCAGQEDINIHKSTSQLQEERGKVTQQDSPKASFTEDGSMFTQPQESSNKCVAAALKDPEIQKDSMIQSQTPQEGHHEPCAGQEGLNIQDNSNKCVAAALKDPDVKTDSMIQTQTPQEGHHEPCAGKKDLNIQKPTSEFQEERGKVTRQDSPKDPDIQKDSMIQSQTPQEGHHEPCAGKEDLNIQENSNKCVAAALKDPDGKTDSKTQTQTPQEGHHEPCAGQEDLNIQKPTSQLQEEHGKVTQQDSPKASFTEDGSMFTQPQESSNKCVAAALKDPDVKTDSMIQNQTPQEGHHEPCAGKEDLNIQENSNKCVAAALKDPDGKTDSKTQNQTPQEGHHEPCAGKKDLNIQKPTSEFQEEHGKVTRQDSPKEPDVQTDSEIQTPQEGHHEPLAGQEDLNNQKPTSQLLEECGEVTQHDSPRASSTNGETMSTLLQEIEEKDQKAASVLKKVDIQTDSEIRSLTPEDLNELFPGQEDLKLRETIFEIIHKQKPTDQLLGQSDTQKKRLKAVCLKRIEYVKNQLDKETLTEAQVNMPENFCKRLDFAKDTHFQINSVIQTLIREGLKNLFPERNYLKMRKTMLEVLHNLPKFVLPGESGDVTEQDPAKADYHGWIKNMKDKLEKMKAVIEKEPDVQTDSDIPTPQEEHHEPLAGQKDLNNQKTTCQPQEESVNVTLQDSPRVERGSDSSSFKSYLQKWFGSSQQPTVKYKMEVFGQTFDAHLQLLNQIQTSGLNLIEGNDKESCITIVFCAVVSRIGTDAEAAMKKVPALDSPAHWFRQQIRAQTCLSGVHSMNPASIYGRETSKVDLNEDEEDSGENQDGPEPGATPDHKITADQVDAVSMDVIETSKLSGSPATSKKPSKSQKRREKKKLTRKKFKPPDISADLMSELPFALTSPTTWKELGFPIPESTEKKRKRKRGDRVDSEEDGDSKKKKRESKRPNYFLSIPITNTQITSAVAEVQERVLQQEPRLAKAMIPVPTLHITLLVTHLANQEQVDLAAAVLGQAGPAVAELLGGRDLVLPFSGIRHFRKEVVFVGLADGEHRRTLERLAELLRSRFEEQNLLQRDGRDFEPHLTIMKLSRASKLRSQGVKRVDPSVYADYTDKFFGSLTVERVDLCSMLKKKQQDGYYHTETSLQLG